MKCYFKGLSLEDSYPDHIGIKALSLAGKVYIELTNKEDLETVIGTYLPKARASPEVSNKSNSLFIIK